MKKSNLQRVFPKPEAARGKKIKGSRFVDDEEKKKATKKKGGGMMMKKKQVIKNAAAEWLRKNKS